MKATLITRFKDAAPEGGITELVVWRVPSPASPSSHNFRYRATYSLGGKQVVGSDNERGRGDHCHLGGVERPYFFTSVEKLTEDFIAAVDAARRAR